MIRKKDGKYCVYSKTGQKLGEYASKDDAERRLRQVEFFAHTKRGKK